MRSHPTGTWYRVETVLLWEWLETWPGQWQRVCVGRIERRMPDA